MNEIITGPELEACGWYVRTKRTDVDAAGWLVADCSTVPHGKEYARLFAAAPKMLDRLRAAAEWLTETNSPAELRNTIAAAIALATLPAEEAPEPVRHVTIAGVDRDPPRYCSFCFEADCNGECSGDGAMGD
ncbi:gp39 domain protein [Burkholderia pseudomallei ABCPW 107]|uniref:hypothetical protein n=1 Tax=Burkholderia pseudomallei TaxID=28450 RepID=UPI0005319004|nr:hypothetical protein [Burkholderia pseudomallei]KGS43914.1 gp39 domain protein [Burkholderia pseudomallei ABCPW 107]